jgi:hypothetical protein
MRFFPVKWSPVELEYLKNNKSQPVNQLCIALAKSISAIKKELARLDGKDTDTGKKLAPGARSAIGKRKDLGNIFVRSRWEANIFRVLVLQYGKENVQYEPTTFSFAPFGVLKGTVAYIPDFRVQISKDEYIWIEVKGYMKREDQTKIRRFMKYYPEEAARLTYITASPNVAASKFFDKVGIPVYAFFNNLRKQYSKTIDHWED